MWGLIRSDLEAAGFGWLAALRRLPQLDGFWLALLHRVAHELYRRGVPWLPYVLGWGVARVIFNAEINPGAEIGPGMRFAHTTGVDDRPGPDRRRVPDLSVGHRWRR